MDGNGGFFGDQRVPQEPVSRSVGLFNQALNEFGQFVHGFDAHPSRRIKESPAVFFSAFRKTAGALGVAKRERPTAPDLGVTKIATPKLAGALFLFIVIVTQEETPKFNLPSAGLLSRNCL